MDQSFLTAPHSLSQSSASFIASTTQGIHHLPFISLTEFLMIILNATALMNVNPLRQSLVLYVIVVITYIGFNNKLSKNIIF